MSGFELTARAAILSTAAGTVSPQLAESLLRRHFGLVGKASALSGERDHNFLVRSARGEAYVLKISHPAESLAAVELQSRALAHIAAADPQLPVPAIIPDAAGRSHHEIDVGGRLRIVRVLGFLRGPMLYQTEASPDQDRNLGAFLARLGRALQGLSMGGPAAADTHLAAGRNGEDVLLWDLQRMADSRTLTECIADRRLRALVERVYEEFDQHARAPLAALPTQPIHNDMNPYNVVMDANDHTQVAGIIDFGDMVRGPLAADVAVGAAYRWTLHEHPLAGVSRFMRGYDSVRPFADAEIDLMLDLVRARLALTISITHWQSRHLADNRDYVMRLQADLVKALDHLAQLDRIEARRFLRAALGRGHAT